MTETATQDAVAWHAGPARHAGPAEPDIAPVPDASGHFVVGAVEAVGNANPAELTWLLLAWPTAAGLLPRH